MQLVNINLLLAGPDMERSSAAIEDEVEVNYVRNLESSLIAQEKKIAVILPITPSHQNRQAKGSTSSPARDDEVDFATLVKLRRQQSCWSKIGSEKKKKKHIISRCGVMFLAIAFIQGTCMCTCKQKSRKK